MPKVIRIGDCGHAARFNLDDVALQAAECVARARAEAENILAAAARDAVAIRDRAEAEGCRAAERAIERMVGERVEDRLTTLRAALEGSYAEFHRAGQEWLAHGESLVVRLAAAMARRVIRDQLRVNPDIPLSLVREALELAAGSTRVRLLMNPADIDGVAGKLQKLLDEFASVARTELVADGAISAGGCRVETEYGAIDQQFETQLARIVEELI